MKKVKNQGLNILYPILVFWTNRKAFFSFLFLIAMPLFIVPIFILYYIDYVPFKLVFSNVFIGLAYFLMIFYVISFTILHKISGDVEIPFNKTLKLIPSLIKKAALITGVFALIIILTQGLFLFAPIVLLVIFPSITFLPIYKSSVINKDLFNENTNYLKTESGKELLGKLILAIVVLLIAIGIINLILNLVFSFANNILIDEGLYSIKLFLRFFVFFITYLFINLYYVENTFSISKTVNIKAVNILSENKTERNRPKTKRRNKNLKEKETNRFEKTDDYNRFEDTNY